VPGARSLPLAFLVFLIAGIRTDHFTNNTVADATQVKADFAALDSRLSKNKQ